MVAWSLSPGAALAERRVALIIGNSDYELVTPLDNPGNDAYDISVALEGLEFEVFLGLDLVHDEMTALTQRFAEAARTADVALFYYAGHGFQVDSANYLVPTDARIASIDDVTGATVPLQSILDKMEAAPGIKFVFLDACRNNPFEGTLEQGAARVGAGLARIGDAADFMISFATQPDNVAYDGAGRNSFFTEALLNHIYTPGQDVSDLMISVRKDVLSATGGRQIPWENSSLTRQFRFDPRPPSVSPETLLWQVAVNARDPQLMQLYAERYPNGAHMGDVMAFLDPSVTGDPAPGQGASRGYAVTQDQSQADRMWELARRSRMRPLVQFYLDTYPEGQYAGDARRLLATLPSSDNANPGRLCERLATHPRDATASTAGVAFAKLAQNAIAAIQACQSAATASPNLPHYTALLARATAAAGDQQQAIRLYRDSAARGDLRAMVSLGLITETGQGVPPDLLAALRLYEKAAQAGSADGMINLAVALFEGVGLERDQPRAIALLKSAADQGSPIATYNLGVLAQNGSAGTPAEALEYFRQATRIGEARGYLAAAILLDEGRGVPRDPDAAAVLLLRGAAEDGGQIVQQLTEAGATWSRETIAAVQSRLGAAGYYTSAVDGLSGPGFAAALETWRNGGFVDDVLVQ
ncbi:peptidase C14, caspase catalytic subunit p20 [Sulfitobacter sabulilitoris]|uniref:Peptidase C14, caspase catalytic subunit p20 n=2 Tax=Sulfitobacter sabulilitoris TaxID=2562655 RepID=A0A5S3PMD4_9RHOB|nr:peptidase C14, caspase catalytic subunit p20 [Sulfitobacter sabulilitoris]